MLKKLAGVLLAIVVFAIGGIACTGTSRSTRCGSSPRRSVPTCSLSLLRRLIATRVLQVDPTRATPAERLNNGRDFVPTHRAIVRPSLRRHRRARPLVGPTLAA
jgi:carbon starvation protein